jgi:hypothetical protein
VVTFRIFLIGFNKCGTTSFHHFFEANGLSSVHWYGNELARCLRRNSRLPGVPPLWSIDRWQAYGDLIALPGTPWDAPRPYRGPLIEANALFPRLHRAYPDSLFILNTRDLDAWLCSRLAHDQGRFAQAYLQALRPRGVTTLAQLQEYWRQQWHQHHQRVRSYFEHRPDALFLDFDLRTGDPQQVCDLLRPHVTITSPHLPHAHRTAPAP